MANIEECRLVRDFKKSRDAELFAPIFLHYRRRVFALAYAFHRDQSQAEDCVQETFLRAFTEIDRYDDKTPIGNFWGWLQRIARNVCIDELRRRQRRSALDELVNPTAAFLTQEEAIILRELRDQLRLLPRAYRRSYLLSADGYSYKEIMDLTGFTYGQVKTFIQTAKRHVSRRFS